jgi:hypothetical protein
MSAKPDAVVLPELPKPSIRAWSDLSETFLRADHYSASQLRAYALAAIEASRADALDAARLDWVLSNRNHRVQGSDTKGWCVLDCSNGLTFVVRDADTARQAIDKARAAITAKSDSGITAQGGGV